MMQEPVATLTVPASVVDGRVRSSIPNKVGRVLLGAWCLVVCRALMGLGPRTLLAVSSVRHEPHPTGWFQDLRQPQQLHQIRAANSRRRKRFA